MTSRTLSALLTGLASFSSALFAAESPPEPGATKPFVPAAQRMAPNLLSNIERPLRYRPDGADFVIENGAEFFNRPLYGGNTAFRVDGGDKPEFSLYLPGRGGNVRLGILTRAGAKWLHDGASITTRYRPGSLLHEIRDPLFGARGVVKLTTLALHQAEGVVVCVDATEIPADAELIFAYGGVTGVRGVRDGDIGTERVPISDYFQLKPEFCAGNEITITGTQFALRAKTRSLAGVLPPDARLTIGDARAWHDPAALLAAPAGAVEQPVVVARMPLSGGRPHHLLVQRSRDGAAPAEDLDTYKEVGAPTPASAKPVAPDRTFRVEDLPRAFAETEAHFAALRSQIQVETPDPFFNAAIGALTVAADAVWDETEGAVMHGAIAWRTKLLGWRGPYAMDALGWHDRARRHLSYWAGRQNTDPLPAEIPPADEDANLARSERALHSNGDMSKSHYDMNTVYIDALFRHLLWTGDLAFAREVWPVIERHLAWERRLFRREFGPEKLPLYEAYAVIWASDDLQYHGGGVAHSSAYQLYHNKMAARLAKLLGVDGSLYEREAELIGRAMREHLWMKDRGTFAEFKDLLGLQRVHPSAGLWTVYHAIDSEVTTPAEAWQLTEYVDRNIPHIPVRGPGVPAGLYTLSTTDWLPYAWSINNVVMGEVMHTALSFWQARRADEAMRMLRGSMTAAMFMGISPGNVGTMSYLDVYRRESQRDFADGSGVLSRAIVEGLFGIMPDALAGELRVAPGFPAEWAHASLKHPDVSLAFTRAGLVETYVVDSRVPRAKTLRFELLTRGGEISGVTVNGKTVRTTLAGEGPAAFLQASSALEGPTTIAVTWKRAPQPTALLADAQVDSGPAAVARAQSVQAVEFPAQPTWECVNLAEHFNERVTRIFKNEYRSPRSPYVSLALPKQGIGGWAGGMKATAEIDDSGLRAASEKNDGCVILPNGLPFSTPATPDAANVLFTSLWDNYPDNATVPLAGRARLVSLLMAGSTNWMQSRIDNGEVVVTYTDGSTSRLALENPTTWWPIEQDFFIDDYQFANPGVPPTRVDLKTGKIRVLDRESMKGKGRTVPGGAATVLHLALDPDKELSTLTVRALSNEVVIGLMAVTLTR